MADIAYIRVSTTDQNTERQLDGVEVVKTFTDKCSGGSTNRPALTDLLDYIREGDTVHVHSIDRLARNLQDLLSLVERFKTKGVALKFHKENLTFEGSVTNAMQDLMLSMIGAVAQFEKAMIDDQNDAKAQEKQEMADLLKDIDAEQTKINGMVDLC